MQLFKHKYFANLIHPTGQILDNSGNEINLQNVRINIQSLGTSECYWLDSGIFDF